MVYRELVHEIYSEEVHAMLQQALVNRSCRRNPKSGLELLPLSSSTFPGQQSLSLCAFHRSRAGSLYRHSAWNFSKSGLFIYDPGPQLLLLGELM